MRTQVWLALALSCGMALAQQVAFTSRNYVQSPVSIASVESSKEFGFEAVELRNDGISAVSAVKFLITVRAEGADDEVADERRVAVSLAPRDGKKIAIGMGQVEGLKQRAKSRKQDAALVIITVEAVEFADGSEWKRTETGVKMDTFPDRIQKK